MVGVPTRCGSREGKAASATLPCGSSTRTALALQALEAPGAPPRDSVVVRMRGVNQDTSKKLLEEGGCFYTPSLSDATSRVLSLVDALSKEVAPLGIKVTIIAPSGFRTDWAGRSASNSKTMITDYLPTVKG